ncbi:hypothetical protein FRC20_005297 [Serendipita sp. 405]|nr:hypothetical protein FRC20_005297 [Serendipita sp. 405]
MGYDGEQLYMLPRAARALETGYNVFTMDMVQGHYLGTRRASQEQRVFKYARKGYGIRILPSYLDALKTVDIEELPPRNWYSHQPKHLNIEKQVEKARDFFDRVFRTYLTWSRGGRNLQRTYVYRKTFTGTSKVIRTMEQKSCNVPIFTHALLDTVAQLLNEPLARSCLTGFELFYRHVGLFEAEAAGKCVIEPSVWASTTYEEVYYSSTYSDLPNYVWDETFRIKTFKKQLDRFNEDQTERTIRGWEISGGEIKEVGKEPLVRRIVHGTTVEEVFEQDLQMMVWMPEDFVVFAREMVAQVAKKCDMEPQNNFINEFWRLPNVKKKHSDRVLYEVKIDTMVMWQQVDRRLDEIFELIWSFMFSNDRMQMEEDARFCLLELQISRRALRSKAENEFLDFALWVARDPGPIAGEDYGGMSRGFWGHALYDAEDPYEGEYVDEDEDDEYDHFLESRMYDRWVGYMLGGGLMGFGGFKMGWDGNDDDDDEYGDDAHGEEH